MKKKILSLVMVCAILMSVSMVAMAASGRGAEDIPIGGNDAAREVNLADNISERVSPDIKVSTGVGSVALSASSERKQGTDEAVFEELGTDNKEVFCETVAIGDNAYQLVKPDGEVFATIYSALDEKDVMPTAENPSWSMNWSVPKGSKLHGTNRFNVYDGFTTMFSLTPTPTGDSLIGFYSVDDGVYYWTHAIDDSVDGFIVFGSNACISFAIKNETSYTINYSGTYETLIL